MHFYYISFRHGFKDFPEDWKTRAVLVHHGMLAVTIPSVEDLLTPKIQRNEPRDIAHAAFMDKLDLRDGD